MRCFIVIFLILQIPVVAFSQYSTDTIYSIINNEECIGHQIIYYSNGKINSEGDYRLILNKESLFMEGIFDFDITTLNKFIKQKPQFNIGRLIQNGTWNYYNLEGNIIRIERWTNNYIDYFEKYYYNKNLNLVYKIETKSNGTYYGSKKDIQLNKDFFEAIAEYEKENKIDLTLSSTSELALNLYFTTNSNRLSIPIRHKELKNGEKFQIEIPHKIGLGDNSDTVFIKFNNGEENIIPVLIKTYGFNLASSNFRQWEEIENQNIKIKRNEKVAYLRDTDACELKIYKYSDKLTFKEIKSGKIEPQIIFPLSLTKNVLNFKDIKKGIYLLREVDYKNNKDLFMKIEIN